MVKKKRDIGYRRQKKDVIEEKEKSKVKGYTEKERKRKKEKGICKEIGKDA